MERKTMVRGPRRGNARVGEGPTDAKTQRRHERKLEKVLANSHGGLAGKSIIEMLEDELTAACVGYLEAKSGTDPHAADVENGNWVSIEHNRGKALGNARGQIRGLVWWEYVKKLEKRHILRAKELNSQVE
jgi:hypothetical protein